MKGSVKLSQQRLLAQQPIRFLWIALRPETSTLQQSLNFPDESSHQSNKGSSASIAAMRSLWFHPFPIKGSILKIQSPQSDHMIAIRRRV
jgi:hypothetical protein